MNPVLAKDRRILPPFGKAAASLDNWIWVRCAERAWRLTREDPSPGNVVIFPKGRAPAAYRWPVRGADVLAFQHDEALEPFLLLIVELLRQGARTVHAYYASQELVVYDPAAERGAA